MFDILKQSIETFENTTPENLIEQGFKNSGVMNGITFVDFEDTCVSVENQKVILKVYQPHIVSRFQNTREVWEDEELTIIIEGKDVRILD